jgi:membrane protease YdiL (CAAX protease family)
MSASTAILALVIYLVLYHLPLNPVRFRWGLHRGLAPMPLEIEQKAKELDWVADLSIQVTLLATVIVLARTSALSPHSMGLSTNNWLEAITLGVVFSVVPLGLSAVLLSHDVSSKVENPYPPISSSRRYGLQLLTVFASEFWRAFCIVALVRSDCPAWIAVGITSVVCAVPSFYQSTWRGVGAAAAGLIPGFLFIKTGSLLAPLALGLIASGYAAYSEGRTLPTLVCPGCGHPVPRLRVPGARWIACPGCGEQLTLSTPFWMVRTGGLMGASLTVLLLYAHGTELLVAALLFIPAFFTFLFVSAFVLALFLPSLSNVELAPLKRSLFRF